MPTENFINKVTQKIIPICGKREANWYYTGLGIRSFDLFDLWKRSNGSRRSLKNIDLIIFKIASFFRSQKRSIRSNKTYFSYVFDSCPPFLRQKIESLPSIFDFRSFLKIDGIHSLSSIFEKNQHWSNRSFDHKKMIVSIENSIIELPTWYYMYHCNLAFCWWKYKCNTGWSTESL